MIKMITNILTNCYNKLLKNNKNHKNINNNIKKSVLNSLNYKNKNLKNNLKIK